MPLITEELLAKGQSAARGWTKAQFSLLGLKWPPVAGWKLRVLGAYLSEEDAAAFIAGKKLPHDLG